MRMGAEGLKPFEEMSGTPEEPLEMLCRQLLESRRERPEIDALLDDVWRSRRPLCPGAVVEPREDEDEG